MLWPASASAEATGDVRGVMFFYLDGGAQDFPWVLDNQYDPAVRAKIDNLLSTYRAAGVNWIRILVATNHFADRSRIHPVPSDELIRKVNDFMAITRAGPNAGRFKIEIVLIPEQTIAGLFTDGAPYTRDKAWFQRWLSNLNYTNLGMVMFGGDLVPCLLSGCDDEANPVPVVANHGAWIRQIWAWKNANHPGLNASYEVVGVQGNSNNDSALLAKLAAWNQRATPSNPITAASIYIDLPAGSSWVDYANATTRIIDRYYSLTGKPLWIDEYGRSVGSSWDDQSGAYWTAQDQSNAYSGFLAATTCWRPYGNAKFAWVAGNDYPYNGKYWFGLVSSFAQGAPQMRPAWNDLTLYYTLQKCP
jgi:hypothetical protein